jgi:hypothetical protein
VVPLAVSVPARIPAGQVAAGPAAAGGDPPAAVPQGGPAGPGDPGFPGDPPR